MPACFPATPESFGPLLLRALVIAGVALLSGCGATVMGANPEGIWFREPFIGTGGADAAAREHCASYGKTAVYKGTLAPAKGYALPVIAYDCR